MIWHNNKTLHLKYHDMAQQQITLHLKYHDMTQQQNFTFKQSTQ